MPAQMLPRVGEYTLPRPRRHMNRAGKGRSKTRGSGSRQGCDREAMHLGRASHQEGTPLAGGPGSWPKGFHSSCHWLSFGSRSNRDREQ